jgi:hypothetical protein
MQPESWWELASTIVAGIATIAIFSFLIRENPFYRFFEHLFIGIAAGLGPVLVIRDFLWPSVLEPMLFGCLYYFIYSQRHAWLAKVVIGFTLGASGALAIRGFFAESVPQIVSSFKPLVVYAGDQLDLLKSFNNCFFVATLLLVMNYFFFSFGREGSLQGKAAPLGRPLLMVCFGAFFGSTVMARLALLVERVQFILVDWAQAILSLFGAK